MCVCMCVCVCVCVCVSDVCVKVYMCVNKEVCVCVSVFSRVSEGVQKREKDERERESPPLSLSC